MGNVFGAKRLQAWGSPGRGWGVTTANGEMVVLARCCLIGRQWLRHASPAALGIMGAVITLRLVGGKSVCVGLCSWAAQGTFT